MLLVKDTKTRFGAVSVALHWYIAASILFLLLTGETMRYLGAHGPLRPFRESLALLHMSVAITAVPFILFRIYWRLSSGKPKTHTQHWTFALTADAVWRLLLIAMVCQIITGPSRQLLRPSDLKWFGITLIPVPPNVTGDYLDFFRRAHIYGAATIAGLLLLHIGGALKHVVINRDSVLQRILWPFAPKAEIKTDSGAAKETIPVLAAAGE
jgi:cytochrome b561